MSNKISDKDKKDWEDFLSKKENLTDKEASLRLDKTKKIIRYDLHGYSLDQANKEIKNLIHASYNNHVFKIIIVTGKGLHSENEKDPYVSKNLGILKYSVPDYIKKNTELMSKIFNITDAEIQDGGSGAFYIFLKKKL